MARSRKYGQVEIKGTNHPVAPSEPVFIVRAKDRHAVALITFYRDLIAEDLAALQQVPEAAPHEFQMIRGMHQDLEHVITDFGHWQGRNGTKQPD